MDRPGFEWNRHSVAGVMTGVMDGTSVVCIPACAKIIYILKMSRSSPGTPIFLFH